MTEASDFSILQDLEISAYESRKLARDQRNGKLCQLWYFHRQVENLVTIREQHLKLLEQESEQVLPFFWIESREESLLVGATAYAKSETVERLLYREHHLDEKEALNLVFQVAKGLSHASKIEVFHGSLSLSCLLSLSQNAQIQVMGFGLPYNEEDLGWYQAPECFKEKRPVEICHDLYALGVLWYQLLTGVPPYRGASKELYSEKKKLIQPHSAISEDIFILLRKMTAPASSDRLQSYTDFFSKLSSIKNRILQVAEEGIVATRSVSEAGQNSENLSLLWNGEARIDQFMQKLEKSKNEEQEVTRRTIRRRRLVLPLMLFVGAFILLLLGTLVLPLLLIEPSQDLFESVDITEKLGVEPQDKMAEIREKLAKEAFAKAEEQYQKSENIAEALGLFKDIARKFRETRTGKDAEAKVFELEKQFQESEKKEYQLALRQSQEKQSEERYQEAIHALELFLLAFPESEFKGESLGFIEKIKKRAEERYREEHQIAEGFIREKRYLEAKRIYQRVLDVYGLKGLTQQAQDALDLLDKKGATSSALSINVDKKNQEAQKNQAYLLGVTMRKQLQEQNPQGAQEALNRGKSAVK
jgi:hypothetical protein